VSFLDKALLNGRNIVETIIGHIKPELRVSYGIEAVIGFGGRGLI
jgi:hypothetical protein